jgi:hypothetical protein
MSYLECSAKKLCIITGIKCPWEEFAQKVLTNQGLNDIIVKEEK